MKAKLCSVPFICLILHSKYVKGKNSTLFCVDGDRCNTFFWLCIFTQHRLRSFSFVHDEMCCGVL